MFPLLNIRLELGTASKYHERMAKRQKTPTSLVGKRIPARREDGSIWQCEKCGRDATEWVTGKNGLRWSVRLRNVTRDFDTRLRVRCNVCLGELDHALATVEESASPPRRQR